jgi:hypothetical protein
VLLRTYTEEEIRKEEGISEKEDKVGEKEIKRKR